MAVAALSISPGIMIQSSLDWLVPAASVPALWGDSQETASRAIWIFFAPTHLLSVPLSEPYSIQDTQFAVEQATCL